MYRCADLFCGGGGAGMGLKLAGFHVTGWDFKTGLNYPFEKRIGDALLADLSEFDFVWASPPCQAHTTLKHRTGKPTLRRGSFQLSSEPVEGYYDLIAETREKLVSWGGPYIIENVIGAPLIDPVQLCGSSFGLMVRRHRIFESNLPIIGTACKHETQPDPIDVSGTGSFQRSERKKKTGGKGRKPKSLWEAREAMGMPWATRREISQAIPPAYSFFLGKQVVAHLCAADAEYAEPATDETRSYGPWWNEQNEAQ